MTNREQDQPLQNLPKVDPREFVDNPDKHLWVEALAQPPNLELLKYLTTLSRETGLVYKNQQWRIIKGFLGFGILARYMPKDADILIHSHWRSSRPRTIPTTGKGIGLAMPSTGDFYNCTPNGKNFIVSSGGITGYSLSLSQEQLDQIFIDPVESSKIGIKIKRDEITDLEVDLAIYKGFLRHIGAKYKLFDWREITEEKLAILLSPQDDKSS